MGEFSDPNSTSPDKGILKANGNFETSDKGKAMGAIAIHVEDLLISGSDVFIEYIPNGMHGDSRYIDMKEIKRPIWE